jgi:hypothetical protein
METLGVVFLAFGMVALLFVGILVGLSMQFKMITKAKNRDVAIPEAFRELILESRKLDNADRASNQVRETVELLN